MSDRALLGVGTVLSFSLPFASNFFGISIIFLFSLLAMLLVCSQEIFTIQLHYREENINFTRRFMSKFPHAPLSFIRYSHIGLSTALIASSLYFIGFIPNIQGSLVLLFSFLTLVRIFDPILGCLSSSETISWSSLIGYLVIFTFAVSSGLDSTKLAIYNFPEEIVQSLLLALVVFTMLNLRMAYYKKFCFLHEQSLESQLRLILIPLLFLSIHQVLAITNGIDVDSIFQR